MADLTIQLTQEVHVKYLNASMGVRYWEDGKVNGVSDDDDNPKMPLKSNDTWEITVNLETGKILGWPAGVTAETHYKVCDAGVYRVLDADRVCVAEKDGYVPRMLSPGGDGYGDYVIMKIDGDGQIENWRADLSYFDDE